MIMVSVILNDIIMIATGRMTATARVMLIGMMVMLVIMKLILNMIFVMI